MFRVLLCLLLVNVFQAAEAAPILPPPLQIEFSATKTRHGCYNLLTYEPKGDSRCGVYGALNVGQAYFGLISFRKYTSFENGSFLVEVAGGYSCYISATSCGLGFAPQWSDFLVGPSGAGFFAGNGNSYGGRFAFNFVSGDGSHDYEDDSAPYFSVVQFRFSNAQLGIAAIPLPGTLPLVATVLVLCSELSDAETPRT